MHCRDLERGRRHYRARLQCVNGLVVAGPTFARESLIVHERGVRELARAFTRQRSVIGLYPKIEPAANHAWCCWCRRGGCIGLPERRERVGLTELWSR